MQRPLAERLRGIGNPVLARDHADEERRDDVDAHAVLGDEAFRLVAHHFELQRVHVDRDDFVKDRQDDRAAVLHDFLPAQAGAHE